MLEINCSHCARLVGKLASKSALAPGLNFVCTTCSYAHYPELNTVGERRDKSSRGEMPEFLRQIFGGGI